MEQGIHFCTTADGARIAYATVGDGPPIMKAANWLSHLEFDWRSPIWRHMLAEFARDHTFIRYDERGNGLSDWNCDDLSFAAWVEDLSAVATAAGLDRFPLLGISQGGAVAIAYAARYPERVSHLILYGTYARGWAKRDSPEEIEQRQAQLTLVRLGWGKDNPAFRQLWTTLYAPDATSEQAQSFNDLQRVSTSPQNAVRLLTEMGNIDVVDLLPQVKVPTLVLHCRDDAGVPFEEGRKIAGSIPGAHFVPLAGRNHLLLEGDPSWTTFVKEVRRFIGADDTSALKQPADSQKPAKPNLKRSDLPERYQIISFLGVGGMGEVYLAEDTRLGRKVALKTLPAEFTNDKERLRRFQHEARTASALNHPNILTIHEVGAETGTHFIATEYIDGDTLRARLKRGRMKIDEVLDVAQQAAFALTAAHGAGIVHRDIKPENIMVRRDGIVKVLDFGLAKLLEDYADEAVDQEADTRAMALTDPGRVLGTPAYMSPEQARGLELDARTDIWSLGVVLYEVVAGRPPFRGETRNHTIVSILETEPPPLASLAAGAPAELQRIVRKALTKDRDSRYQTARDLMIDLKNLRRELDLQSEMQRSVPQTSSRSDSGAASQTAPPAMSAKSGSEPLQAKGRFGTGSESFVEKVKRHWVAFMLVAVALIFIPLAISLAAIITYWQSKSTAPALITSIAVLPFANDSGNIDTDYLSDGISESLINSLSQLPNVKVIARSSSFKYKGKQVDPQEVARTLGVEAILTGRVLQRDDALLISVELVNARDKTQIWGGRYDRKATDLLAVQSEISREIAEKLRLRLTAGQQQQLARHETVNPQAYELLLKGRFNWNKGGTQNRMRAVEYFHQAITVDPAYALAYAELSVGYSNLIYSASLDPKMFAPKAEEAAKKALELNAGLAEAHRALAITKLFAWEWAEAEREFARAIELNPSLARAREGYAFYLSITARHDQALSEVKRARELDPLSTVVNFAVGYRLFFARRYDEAIEAAKKTLELDQNFPDPHVLLGYAYAAKGNYAEAIAAYQRAIKLGDDSPDTQIYLGAAYARAGEQEKARSILKQLETRKDYVSPGALAVLYGSLGLEEQAFASLEKGFAAHDLQLQFLRVEPMFDSLRPDPRFSDLLRRVGLP